MMSKTPYNPASEGAEMNFSSKMSYTDYLGLDKILDAQKPLGKAHDECYLSSSIKHLNYGCDLPFTNLMRRGMPLKRTVFRKHLKCYPELPKYLNS